MPKFKVRPVPIYRKQADFLTATEWLSGFCGGRGTGKTWVGAYRVQREAKAGEPWMGVSPDAGVVHETTFPTFKEVAVKTGVFIRERLSPYPHIWWRTHDGGVADIVFRSSEVPSKLRGPSKAGLWIDEASVCSKETFDVAIATLRHEGHMGPCLLTFTPKGRAHWTFDAFFDTVDDIHNPSGNDGATTDGIEWIQGRPYRHKENSRLIRAHTLDNPFLPEQFAGILRARYTATLAEQELAGEFVDISGLMFSRPWFLPVESAPRDARRVRYWDRAASVTESSCYSAGALLAMDNRGLVYVEDVVRGQWSALDRNRVMEQTAQRDAYRYDGEVMIYTEQEGGSGGKEVSQQIVRMLSGHPVFIDNVGGQRSRTVDGQKLPGEAKVIRAMPFAAQAEAGNVRLVRGAWNADYLDELCAFPELNTADQVDATSGAYNMLAKGIDRDIPAAVKSRIQPNVTSRFGAGLALERARQRRQNDR